MIIPIYEAETFLASEYRGEAQAVGRDVVRSFAPIADLAEPRSTGSVFTRRGGMEPAHYVKCPVDARWALLNGKLYVQLRTGRYLDAFNTLYMARTNTDGFIAVDGPAAPIAASSPAEPSPAPSPRTETANAIDDPFPFRLRG